MKAMTFGSSVLMSGLCLVAAVACTALPEAKKAPAQTWQARLKAVEDSLCSVTNLVVVDAKTGLVRVDFVLRAEPESVIRCRAELPSPEKWDGRLWGVGNSSLGGFIPKLRAYTDMGAAAVTTDIGTWAMVTGKRDFDSWPLAVRRDYSWRATHLMTIYGKRMVEAYYGKAPGKSYFHGGSCGGRQAFSEAIRYPADYDGIVTHLPANNYMANKFNAWLAWYYTRDKNEKLVFTTNEMQTVADAAVEYRAASDPKPYAGHFLADGRATPEEVEAMLALAAKKMPSLLEGDKLARLKALYTPFCVDGKCLTTGFTPGTYLGQRMKRSAAKSWQSVMEFAKRDGDWYNANTADLTPFFARGGRMMILAGWEDQTISPLPIVDHYERICAFEGGLEKAMEHCRLFCAPGVAHGGGKGRATQGGAGKVCAAYGRKAIIEWVEKGVAPDRIVVEDKPRGTTFPVATYPGLFIQNDKGEWTRTERPRSKPTLAEITFACDRTPPGAVEPCAAGRPRAAAEAPLVMQDVAHRGIWKGRNIPENTVESIKLAYDSGATWVETDFYVTKAGQFICIHGQRELKKYAGVEKKIAALTPEDIATINLGANLKTDKVFRIPLLHQVLAVVPKHGVLQAEIKGYTKDYAVLFDKAVKEAGLSETNIMVSSFHYDALKDFKKRCPKYRTLWLTTIPKGKQFADVMQEQIAKCKAANFDIFCAGGIFAERIKTEEADAVRAAGFDFRLWGVNSEQQLREAKRLKATGFTCNYWQEAFDWAEKIGGITLLK